MTDRELLERAAKAAGITILRSRLDDPMWRDMLLADVAYANGRQGWNPLTDDGDALRLAVSRRVRFWIEGGTEAEGGKSWVVGDNMRGPEHFIEVVNGDEMAAVRRAIVRAAAEMTK